MFFDIISNDTVFSFIKNLYLLSGLISLVCIWVYSSHVDKVHFRERMRRYGVFTISNIEKYVNRYYLLQFKINILRPMALVFESICGFLDGLEIDNPTVVIMENKCIWNLDDNPNDLQDDVSNNEMIEKMITLESKDKPQVQSIGLVMNNRRHEIIQARQVKTDKVVVMEPILESQTMEGESFNFTREIGDSDYGLDTEELEEKKAQNRKVKLARRKFVKKE